MNLGFEPGNGKQTYVVSISVYRDNGKMTQKEMSKSFLLQNYQILWLHVTEM